MLLNISVRVFSIVSIDSIVSIVTHIYLISTLGAADLCTVAKKFSNRPKDFQPRQ